MNSDLRLEAMMKSIDVYGRLAFGGQCVAAMAIIAAPLIFVVACILPFVLWGDDNHAGAIGAWLGGWAAAIGTGAAGVALGVFSWRWSGDWITEWPGYAVAFGIAGVANAVCAYLLTATPVPIYGSFAVTIGAAFVAGLLVAGHLGGMRVLPDQREELERQRAIARRR
ncbi:MAG: hypothetical protein M3P30_01825 [Chloroflexota bacterium]|nr:hypothetical protein [Chloroflexota bacterium]